MVEKLLSLLQGIYFSEENKVYLTKEAFIKRISILFVLKDNSYVDLNDKFNIEDIKIINIKNQLTDKQIMISVKDLKSCSKKNQKLYVNHRFLTLN